MRFIFYRLFTHTIWSGYCPQADFSQWAVKCRFSHVLVCVCRCVTADRFHVCNTPTRSLLIHSRQTSALFTHVAHPDSELGSWQGQVLGQIMQTVVFTHTTPPAKYSACVKKAYVARMLVSPPVITDAVKHIYFQLKKNKKKNRSVCISPKLILFQFAVEACDPNSDEWGVRPFWCNGRFGLNKALELSSCDRILQDTCWCQVTTELNSQCRLLVTMSAVFS